MRKTIAFALAGIITAAALASCAPAADRTDSAITLASSAASANAAWLDERLDTFPTEVILGVGSNEAYGVDMSAFESDGYILRTIGEETLVFGKTEEGLDRAVRAYAKAADAGTAEALNETYHEGYRIEKLTIAGNDISEYTVVYNNDAKATKPVNYQFTEGNSHYAANELVRLIEKATGVTLPMKTVEDNVSGKRILIDYLASDVRDRTFSYEVKDGDLLMYGEGGGNGCTYAVYHFLEYRCGWDSLITHGDSNIAEADHVDVPEGTTEYVEPMFTQFYYLRALLNFPFKTDNASINWLGQYGRACHGMQYSLWAGVPCDLNQICYTDKGRYDSVYDNVLNYIETSVAAGKRIGVTLTHIDLGHGDNSNFCLCKDCIAVFAEEGKAHAGVQVRFVNRLAEDMELEGYGGLYYHIFAYRGTNNPPAKAVPRDDIYITFTTDGMCVNHSLNAEEGRECTGVAFDVGSFQDKDFSVPGWDDQVNSIDFTDWLKQWAEITENILIWHYALDNNLHQYTYLDTLYDDIKFMYEIGAKGLYLEQENMGLGLARVRLQLVSRMNFNSDMTREEYDALLMETLRKEYGDGYEYVKKAIDIWHETELAVGCRSCWHYDYLITADEFDTHMFSERADELVALLDKAKPLCENVDQEKRLERLQMDFLYKQCYTTYFDAYDAEDTEAIEYLKTRYELFKKYAANNGYNIAKFPIKLSMSNTWPISEDMETEAWSTWVHWRDGLIKEGTTQKPAPEGYVLNPPCFVPQY